MGFWIYKTIIMKSTFKTGLLVGCIIGLGIILTGYVTINNMMAKSENISTMDLHQLQYQNLEGEEVLLSKFEGKYVLVNFWATWCIPCIEEFPLLNETYNLVNNDFEFVMVSYESQEKINAFIKDKPYNFTFLKSNNFILEGITSVPQSFILDTLGKTIYHHPTIFEGTKEEVMAHLYQHIKN